MYHFRTPLDLYVVSTVDPGGGGASDPTVKFTNAFCFYYTVRLTPVLAVIQSYCNEGYGLKVISDQKNLFISLLKLSSLYSQDAGERGGGGGGVT